MKPFHQCPVCGGELEKKNVEKLLRGGNHTLSIVVEAEVCLHCGERLYPEETIRSFESIRKKLSHQQLSEFQPVGQFLKVADPPPFYPAS